MKTITTQIISMVAVVAGLKRKFVLLMIQLTNLKPVATLQTIIISMAN